MDPFQREEINPATRLKLKEYWEYIESYRVVVDEGLLKENDIALTFSPLLGEKDE
jgi:hypothetical protein